MFAAVSPRPGDAPAAQDGWGIRRAVRLDFPQPAALAHDAAHAARLDPYLRDLLRQRPYLFGRTARDPARGGQSYSEMAEALLGLAVPEREAVDLLVLAYSIPDINPGRNLTAQLSRRCAGDPLAFAISDQGTAAAFTGLRLIREYARQTGLRRAVLLVVEQAELPYDPGVPVAIPDGHSGVALLFGDASDGPRPSCGAVRLGTVATRAGLHEEALAEEVGSLCAAAPGATVILGAALAQKVTAPAAIDRVRTAPAGRPYTGVWWELADELSAANDAPRRVVLGDYDPIQSCLCLAVLDVGPVDEPAPVGARSALTAEPLHAGS